MYEQLSLFDIIQQSKNIEGNQCLGEPCASCNVEFGSSKCFVKRGYMWDPINRFLKNENGKCLRRNLEKRECKKIFKKGEDNGQTDTKERDGHGEINKL